MTSRGIVSLLDCGGLLGHLRGALVLSLGRSLGGVSRAKYGVQAHLMLEVFFTLREVLRTVNDFRIELRLALDIEF